MTIRVTPLRHLNCISSLKSLLGHYLSYIGLKDILSAAGTPGKMIFSTVALYCFASTISREVSNASTLPTDSTVGLAPFYCVSILLTFTALHRSLLILVDLAALRLTGNSDIFGDAVRVEGQQESLNLCFLV